MTTTPATVEGLTLPASATASVSLVERLLIEHDFADHIALDRSWRITSFGPLAADGERQYLEAERLAAQPSEAVQRLAAEQFPLPPAKAQAYADTNGLPTDDVKTCESCPTCGAPVTVFQPKVGEPIYTHNPAAGVALDRKASGETGNSDA
jgi:hypothetical protein